MWRGFGVRTKPAGVHNKCKADMERIKDKHEKGSKSRNWNVNTKRRPEKVRSPGLQTTPHTRRSGKAASKTDHQKK
jgi:hypothetical protein